MKLTAATTSTLSTLLRATVARYEDRPAIVVGDTSVSFGELWSRSARAAKAMIARGVQPGDRIGSWSPNVVESIVLQCAAPRAGALVVHLDPEWDAEQAAEALERMEVRALFVRACHEGRQYPAMVKSIRGRLPHLRDVVTHGRQPRFERGLSGGWLEFLDAGDGVPDGALAEREDPSSARGQQPPAALGGLVFDSLSSLLRGAAVVLPGAGANAVARTGSRTTSSAATYD